MVSSTYGRKMNEQENNFKTFDYEGHVFYYFDIVNDVKKKLHSIIESSIYTNKHL